MRDNLTKGGEGGLEGLCGQKAGAAQAAIRIGSGTAGIERAEARFANEAFAPHRHDTYALGITLAGVQTFRYRGTQRYCLPGQGHILHPDELHDGAAATRAGFSYRIVYIDPLLVQRALGGRPLPFVADPVVSDARLLSELVSSLANIDDPLGEVDGVDIGVALAGMLELLAGARSSHCGTLNMPALLRVREAIAATPASPCSLSQLEAIAGLDRWTIARQFRAAFGTSPSRFRTMRQLDLARRLIRIGRPLIAAAHEAGFADQSHMSRMFKRTYGLTPGQWAAALHAPLG